MAFEITEISKFSVDAIDMEYEQLPEGQKEHMKQNVTTILKNLGMKKKKTKVKGGKLSDEEVFKKDI